MDSSIKYLSARVYSNFTAAHLQNPRAALAYSASPLRLFKNPYEQKSKPKQEKNADFVSISSFFTFLVKAVICG